MHRPYRDERTLAGPPARRVVTQEAQKPKVQFESKFLFIKVDVFETGRVSSAGFELALPPTAEHAAPERVRGRVVGVKVDPSETRTLKWDVLSTG